MNPTESQTLGNSLRGVAFEELWERSAKGDQLATDEMSRRCTEYWKAKEQMATVLGLHNQNRTGMQQGDKIKVEVSDRKGVWLDGTVEMVNKHNKPGLIFVDEGIPAPFGYADGKQVLCVFHHENGDAADLHYPHRHIRYKYGNA